MIGNGSDLHAERSRLRVSKVEIENYRGVRKASFGRLSERPLTLISGANGTGKSLVLEAIAYTWANRYGAQPDRIGPWGSSFSVSFSLELNEVERETVHRWYAEVQGARGHVIDDTMLTITHTCRRDGNHQVNQGWPFEVLRNTQFQRENSFAALEFLSASRILPSQRASTIDPAILSQDRIESERLSLLDQHVAQRTPMQLTGVAGYLAVLDYVDALAARDGLDRDSEFDGISAAFEGATGKSLVRPRPLSRGDLEVTVEFLGNEHPLDDLSSGEKEMLSLMYYVRRLSADGGVLLLDEPEQHLHPSLQAALFQSISSGFVDGQVICVTHSPNIIAASSAESIFELRGPGAAGSEDQARSVAEPGEKRAMLADLGVSASSIAQYEGLLVLEGKTDESFLRRLLAPPVARFSVVTAGSFYEVDQTRQALERTEQLLPWICVVDRDLRSDEEVGRLQDLGLFVWSGRAIENNFVERSLIERLSERVGGAEGSFERLRSAAEDFKSEVVRELAKHRLSETTRAAPVTPGASEVEKLRQYFQNQAVSYQQRAQALDATLTAVQAEVDATWETAWPRLVDPKKLLRRFASQAETPFSGYAALIDALIQVCVDEPELAPPDFQRLSEVMRSRFAG